MDTVNGFCGNIHCTVETKCHICSPDIVINCFRKMNNIQTFFSQKISGFLCAVSAQNNQTIQTQLMIILLHGFYFVQTFFIRCPHQLERLTGRSQNRTASRKNTGKIFGSQHTVISVNQTFISIHKTINFQFVQIVGQTFYNSAHGSIQSLTVTAACQ